MLRIKKYTMKNRNTMIQFLKNFEYDESDDFDACNKMDSVKYSICYFYLYLKKYLDIRVIKDTLNTTDTSNIPYKIIKDSFTETWFFTCSKMIVLYVNEDDIHDFYDKYRYSKYKFLIYQDSDYYIIFCTSHTSDQIQDNLEFLVNNNVNPKYLLFSCFFENMNNTDHLNPQSSSNRYDKQYDEQYLDYNIDIMLKKAKPTGFVILNNNYKHNMKDFFTENTKRMCFFSSVGQGENNKKLAELVKVVLKLVNVYSHLPVNYFI